MAKMSKKWAMLCSTAIAAVYAAGYLTTETQASVQQPQQIQVNSNTSDGQSEAASTDSSQSNVQPPQQSQVDTQSSNGQSEQVSTNSDKTNVQTPQQSQVNTKSSSSKSAGVTTNSSKTNVQPQQSQAGAQASNSQAAKVSTAAPKTNSRYKDGTFTGMGSNRRGSIQVTVSIKNDKITDVEISDFGMHYSERDVEGLPQEVLQKQSATVQNVSGATYSTRAFEDAVRDALSQAANA